MESVEGKQTESIEQKADDVRLTLTMLREMEVMDERELATSELLPILANEFPDLDDAIDEVADDEAAVQSAEFNLEQSADILKTAISNKLAELEERLGIDRSAE